VAFEEIKNRLERKRYLEMTKDMKFLHPEDDDDAK
jgi:hypothetical protein